MKSGILGKDWAKGDVLMADRGFEIQDDLAPMGVKLNIPPFLKGKGQFEEDELVETRRIAKFRIHVERAIPIPILTPSFRRFLAMFSPLSGSMRSLSRPPSI